MKKYVIRFVAAAMASLSVLAVLASDGNAQTDLDALRNAVQQQRRFGARPRFFNPFSPSRASRLSADPFRSSIFSAFSSPFNDPFFDDPFSSTEDSSDSSSQDSSETATLAPATVAPETMAPATPAPIVVAPISGSQAFFPSSSSSSSGFPWVPRPVRSPYRPPPRLPF